MNIDAAASLLRRDVVATLGERIAVVHVDESLARFKEWNPHLTDAGTFVDHVQQDFHDLFIDVTWPACPRHPNHPMNHADGVWRCPRDGADIARLGELGSVRSQRGP